MENADLVKDCLVCLLGIELGSKLGESRGEDSLTN